MGAAAPARRLAPSPERRRQTVSRPARPAARRAPQARARAAQRARLTRAFVIFVICLTALAVGRVSLSFAVVQKSLQTDAVVREQRRVSAENAQLAETLAQLSSSVRITSIARSELKLVDATHVQYLTVSRGGDMLKVVAER